MNEITEKELYDFYLDTIGRCASDIKELCDEDIEYNLFEEFDVGVHSFLHKDNLAILRQVGFIDDEAFVLANEVRRRWLDLQEHSWTVEEIKNKKEWQELFHLCDQLKIMARNPSVSKKRTS